MCTLTAGLAGALGLFQYKQQQEAAENQAAMYRAQAKMAEQNARVEGKKQESIADKYAQEASRLRSRHNLAAGAARAQAGAANLGIAGGTSAMDILASGFTAYGQDQMNLLSNQRNDNYASRVQQSNYEADAANNYAAADTVERQAKLQGIATILGTAASVTGIMKDSWGGSEKNGSINENGSLYTPTLSPYGPMKKITGNSPWKGTLTYKRT